MRKGPERVGEFGVARGCKKIKRRQIQAFTAETQPAVAFAFAKATAGSGHGEFEEGWATVRG
jgi:hypothetical protein